MTDIVNPEYAVERLKILAEDICKVKEDAHVCDCRIYYFGSEFRQMSPKHPIDFSRQKCYTCHVNNRVTKL